MASKHNSNRDLSVPEFARLVNRTRQAIQQAIVAGHLPGCYRIPGPGRQPWRVPRSNLAIYQG